MSEEKGVEGKVQCERCGAKGAVFKQYGLKLCRRCFREMAPKIGFEKHE